MTATRARKPPAEPRLPIRGAVEDSPHPVGGGPAQADGEPLPDIENPGGEHEAEREV